MAGANIKPFAKISQHFVNHRKLGFGSGKARKVLTVRLYIHETRKDDLQKITNFWAKKLSIRPDIIKISWKRNLVIKRRYNKDYVGQCGVRVIGISHFTSKLLAISDIILGRLLKN